MGAPQVSGGFISPSIFFLMSIGSPWYIFSPSNLSTFVTHPETVPGVWLGAFLTVMISASALDEIDSFTKYIKCWMPVRWRIYGVEPRGDLSSMPDVDIPVILSFESWLTLEELFDVIGQGKVKVPEWFSC